MKCKNEKEVQILLENFKLAEENFKKESDRIMWQLVKYTSKQDIAKRLGIDRKTLYNKYFPKRVI